MTCEDCPYAVWDYAEFYNTRAKQWLVVDCKKGREESDCEEENE